MFGITTDSLKKAFGIGEERKSYSLSDPEARFLFGPSSTASGALVTANTALHVPAVLQAVRLIAENVGSIPIKLHRERDGKKETAKDHPAYRLVNDRVSGFLTAGRLRVFLTRDAMLAGGGYARVIRVGDDRPYEMQYLAPHAVQIRYEDDGEPVYLVAEKGRQLRFSYRDVLHMPSFDGVALTTHGRNAIGFGMDLERHGSSFFADGARPSGLITAANPIDPTSSKGTTTLGNILRSWRAWVSGATGEPLVLDNGQNYVPLTMHSTDAQFLENRVEQVREIARLFGVPTTMLFDLSNGSYSNTEQMAASFHQFCLRPWLDRWQEAYDTVLLTEAEQREYYFEAVIDDIQRADAQARSEVWSKGIAARYYTPNEVRAWQNLPPLPGGDELVNPFTTTSTTGPATPPAKDAA